MSGPRKLSSLVAQWQPLSRGGKSASADEMLVAVTAAWEQAVGAAVARRSRPTKLNNGILSVLTASSAWSNELLLLSSQILSALRAAVPQAHLQRLRFSVASGRSRLLLEGSRGRAAAAPARPVRSSVSQRHAPSAAHDEDISALVARLSASQRLLDEERDRAGWQRCLMCGQRFPNFSAGMRNCAVCTQAKAESEQALVERALVQAPWLGAREIRQMCPGVRSSAYERARQRLLARWQLELGGATGRMRASKLTAGDRVAAWSYLMLLTGLAQSDVSRAVIGDTLGPAWVDALFDVQTAPPQARRALREKHR